MARTKKTVEKTAEVKKPVVTSARAIARDVRVTPRKVRLVIDLVRGKGVKEALGILANTNKAASTPVAKLIKSAAANATNNFGLDLETLYVAEIYANEGVKMKRYLPRAVAYQRVFAVYPKRKYKLRRISPLNRIKRPRTFKGLVQKTV